MSRFTGKQYKGAQKANKEIRREEAEKRNAQTAPENRKATRREQTGA
jgi:hypothetical protein